MFCRFFSFVATLAVIVLTLHVPSAMAQSVEGGGYGHHHWGGPWGGWFMGPGMMLGLIAVVVIAVFFIMRRTGGSDVRDGSSDKTPLDILKERFAKGEIDKEEFEARREVIGD